MADPGRWFRKLFERSEPALTSLQTGARALPEAAPTQSGHADHRFALALYDRLRQRPGDLCVSPFSIRTALGMTLAGARGETAAQMADVLGATVSDETAHADDAALIRRLHSSWQYTFAVANSLWTQHGPPLLPAFLDIVERHYCGAFEALDIHGAPDAAAAAINQWVERATHGRISGLITPRLLCSLTRLVLVNAVYFNARWASEFNPLSTNDQPFHLEAGGRVSVPLMHQRTWAGYLHADGFEALDLPYRGDSLSLLVLLPNRAVRLSAFEDSLSPALLDDVVARMDEEQQVDVYLPRFTKTWGAVDLGADLAALGMPLAFDATRADFSGMNGRQPPDVEALFLSAVVHKTFIEVNERGTEAAAATAAYMECTAALDPPPVPEFRADRPFVYAIRDRRSGALLFLGRLVNPTANG